jgi:peptidoglycan/LPS O-acetylase OafA/YrhL
MPETPKRPRFYRPELDVLRFCAFALVFFWHGHIYLNIEARFGPATLRTLEQSFLNFGVFGVDIFFALSAYLITELLLRERSSTGTVQIRNFYLRRSLRIWPLYFAVLLVIRPIFQQLVPFDHFRLRYLAAFSALGGNWSVARWGWPAASRTLQPRRYSTSMRDLSR